MAKYKTRGEAIKDLRKRAKMSQDELARKLDTTKQTIYKYESGIVTNIPSDKIEIMSRVFGVSPAVIMGWDDAPAVPVYSAAAGQGRIDDGYPDEEYPIRLEADEFIYEVHGSSMEPTLHDGDKVVVVAQSVIDSPNQIALVKINGEEAALKHVQVEDDGITLLGENYSVFTPRRYTSEQVIDLPVRIIGVVRMLIREL